MALVKAKARQPQSFKCVPLRTNVEVEQINLSSLHASRKGVKQPATGMCRTQSLSGGAGTGAVLQER